MAINADHGRSRALNPALIRRPGGTKRGLEWITRAGEKELDTGMDFGLLRLAPGETMDLSSSNEVAALLLDGAVRFRWAGGERGAERHSLFEEDPFALHVPAGSPIEIVAQSESELAIFRTANDRQFEPILYDGSNLLMSEHRARGRLEDTAYRLVRTIFDDRNRPEANLVLGEVVTLPGRWSSYPPHHHPQTEIYHYRLMPEQAYGHGELGDEVLKVRHYDTVKIFAGNEHAQVAVPGSSMWYLWVIRHLPDARYSVPEVRDEHRWMNDAQAWSPAWRIVDGRSQ
jgi:5-deoxy-D-glucuronate isomerase